MDRREGTTAEIRARTDLEGGIETSFKVSVGLTMNEQLSWCRISKLD